MTTSPALPPGLIQAALCGATRFDASLAREIRDRLNYFYLQTDGTHGFPNSAEGDLLKMVLRLLTPEAPSQSALAPVAAPELGAADVELLRRERLAHGFLKVDRHTLRHRRFDGSWSPEVTRELIERGDAVAVLMHDPQAQSLLLVEQFRIGAMRDAAGPWLLETVAGVIGAGESPEQVARREATEEAGVELAALEPIGTFYLSPGGSSEKLHLYYGALDLSTAGGTHGLACEHEDIRATVVPLQAALAAAASGRICNATTLVGLYWLQARLGL